jgi:hypothetical protein
MPIDFLPWLSHSGPRVGPVEGRDHRDPLSFSGTGVEARDLRVELARESTYNAGCKPSWPDCSRAVVCFMIHERFGADRFEFSGRRTAPVCASRYGQIVFDNRVGFNEAMDNLGTANCHIAGEMAQTRAKWTSYSK